MSEEEMEILKELSEQSYFGDLPFLFYADLIGKLIANYNKEKEKNKELIDGEIETLEKILLPELLKKYISKDKIRETIKELEGQEIWYIENKGLDELYGRIDMLKELLEEE